MGSRGRKKHRGLPSYASRGSPLMHARKPREKVAVDLDKGKGRRERNRCALVSSQRTGRCEGVQTGATSELDERLTESATSAEEEIVELLLLRLSRSSPLGIERRKRGRERGRYSVAPERGEVRRSSKPHGTSSLFKDIPYHVQNQLEEVWDLLKEEGQGDGARWSIERVSLCSLNLSSPIATPQAFWSAQSRGRQRHALLELVDPEQKMG